MVVSYYSFLDHTALRHMWPWPSSSLQLKQSPKRLIAVNSLPAVLPSSFINKSFVEGRPRRCIPMLCSSTSSYMFKEQLLQDSDGCLFWGKSQKKVIGAGCNSYSSTDLKVTTETHHVVFFFLYYHSIFLLPSWSTSGSLGWLPYTFQTEVAWELSFSIKIGQGYTKSCPKGSCTCQYSSIVLIPTLPPADDQSQKFLPRWWFLFMFNSLWLQAAWNAQASVMTFFLCLCRSILS